MHFWGHPTLQPLVSCGMMTSSDGVSAWVMPISPAWLVVSQEQTIMALVSSETGAGSVGSKGDLSSSSGEADGQHSFRMKSSKSGGEWRCRSTMSYCSCFSEHS